MDVSHETFIKVEPLSAECELPYYLDGTPVDNNSKMDIEEMDLKIEVKHNAEKDEDGNAAERFITMEMPRKTAGGITDLHLSTKAKSDVASCQPRKQNRTCGDFGDFTLLRCPACDKTFKGGKRRALWLLNHVKNHHYRHRKRLVSLVTRFMQDKQVVT